MTERLAGDAKSRSGNASARSIEGHGRPLGEEEGPRRGAEPSSATELGHAELAQKLDNLESLFNILAQLEGLSERAKHVPRLANVTRTEFLTQYYSANRPVVLMDFARSWQAFRQWNPTYLSEKLGDENVEVMTSRNRAAGHDVSWEGRRTVMQFRRYIELVMSEGIGNDCYLVANNHFFDSPNARELLNDVDIDKRYLDPARMIEGVFLW